jgi:hypothetical protein
VPPGDELAREQEYAMIERTQPRFRFGIRQLMVYVAIIGILLWALIGVLKFPEFLSFFARILGFLVLPALLGLPLLILPLLAVFLSCEPKKTKG